MPCLFGYRHETFNLCDLLDTENLADNKLICSKCAREYRRDYEMILRDEKMEDYDGGFDDFLSTIVEQELIDICKAFYTFNRCEFTVEQFAIASRNLVKIYDNFMDREEAKYEAHVTSVEILPEDLVN
jgi:hypothetical protein